MAGFRKKIFVFLVLVFALTAFAFAQNNPIVVLETNCGNIFIELFPDAAPITVDNFLGYVNSGFYDYLLFHRSVQSDYFIIQAGGYYFYNGNFYEPYTELPIINESYNGLSNLRGTIAMARTNAPNSATSQFFINNADNIMFDRQDANNVGYCVFGQVVEGLDVVDVIAASPVIDYYPQYQNDPFNTIPDPFIGIYAAYVLPCSSPECSDFSGDGKVNFKDFAIFALQWMNNGCDSANGFCGQCDLDYSGRCDTADLDIFADNWLF